MSRFEQIKPATRNNIFQTVKTDRANALRTTDRYNDSHNDSCNTSRNDSRNDSCNTSRNDSRNDRSNFSTPTSANIFKSSIPKKTQNNQKVPTIQNNQFTRSQQKSINMLNILNIIENFPELGKINDTQRLAKIQATNTDYLQKIKQKKEALQEERASQLKPGWIYLVRETPVRETPVRETPVRETPVRETPVTSHLTETDDSRINEANPYYNPKMTYQIRHDRECYRDELNELFGDRSPYWNMDYCDATTGSDNESEPTQLQNANHNQGYSEDEAEDEQQEWW